MSKGGNSSFIYRKSWRVELAIISLLKKLAQPVLVWWKNAVTHSDTFMALEWLKKHPKRLTSFEDAKIILEYPIHEIGGDLKSDDPEQYYSVGVAANGTMITLIYEYRYDEDGPYIWLITLWKTTKEEKKRLKNA